MQKLSLLPLILPEIKELLAARDFEALRQFLTDADPVDLADGWRMLSREEQVILFRLLPRRLQSQVFEELELDEQRSLLEHLREESIQALLTQMDPSKTSQLARELPPRLVQRFLGLMKREEATQVEQHLSFPEKSVGSIMRTRFMTVNSAWPAHRAVEHMRVNSRLRHIDEIYLETIYVRDNGHLIGEVPLKALVVAPHDMPVSQVMDRRVQILTPEMDQEEAAAVFQRYKLTSAPVVDAEGKLLGVVLVRDVFDVIEQETEEDFAKMAGLQQSGLLSHSPLYITRMRFPWLITTCLGYVVVGWVIKHYELTLTHVIGLASFMPLIAAMGGNVGAQTATVVVRGLATREISMLKITEVVVKEAVVGALLGLFYGVSAAIVAHFIYGERFGWKFSLVIGTGMFASMTAAGLMGALEPFIFTRLRIDPATATGPLITFCADLVSTATYLTVATWLFLA